jgi:Ca2+-binding EF-hand superfamily protein
MLPESFQMEREMNSRTLASRLLGRVSSRCAGIQQVRAALEALSPDPRGYVASIFVKAVLLDYSEALGLTDEHVRECLYALDKTASGEVSEDDLRTVLLGRNPPAAAAVAQAAESNQCQTIAAELQQALGGLFDDARQAFEILDACSTGVVSVDTFRSTLGQLGFELPEVVQMPISYRGSRV